LPNLFLVSNPYRVVRASGTIISATVSLGYDTPRGRIEECLLQAARSVGLEEPFVQVADLGDFSVTYQIAGLFTEVKQTVTCRSNLRKHVMDALHRVGIEIVSPTFMSTRTLDPHSHIRPTRAQPVAEKGARPPEAIMFDKAEEAESLENIRDRLAKIETELADAEAGLKAADDNHKTVVERELEALNQERERLTRDQKILEDLIENDGKD
jgi:small-conductance mechanosensitive channel